MKETTVIESPYALTIIGDSNPTYIFRVRGGESDKPTASAVAAEIRRHKEALAKLLREVEASPA